MSTFNLQTHGFQRLLVHDADISSLIPGANFSRGPVLTVLKGGVYFNPDGSITSYANHGLNVNDPVRFAGVLPPEINGNTVYYVKDQTGAKTFTIAPTVGGTAIPTFSAMGPNDVVLNTVPYPYDDTATQAVNVWANLGPNTILWASGGDAEWLFDGVGWTAWGAAYNFIQNLFLTATESLSTADVATRTGSFSFSASESLSTSDLVTRLLLLIRDAGESLSTTDSPVEVTSQPRSASESLSTSDVATIIRDLLRAATDALSTADAAERIVSLLRSPVHDAPGGGQDPGSVNLLVADDATHNVPLSRAASEFLQTFDSASPSRGPVAGASESLTTADVASRILNLLRTVAETLVTSDVATDSGGGGHGHKNIKRKTTEALKILERTNAQRALYRSISEALATADVTTARKIVLRSAAENLSTSDLATRAGALHRTTVGLLAIESVASILRDLHISVSDSLSVSDQAVGSVRYLFNRSVTEFLVVAEFIEWTLIVPPPEEWQYWLDLRIGNFPTESIIDAGDAQSAMSAPDAESSLAAPDAESALAQSVASSSGFRYVNP